MLRTIRCKRFCLPDTMRNEMRKQFGVLYQGNGEDTVRRMLKDLGSAAKIITIGDISTFNLLQSGTVPDICVVDEKTKRAPAASDIVKGIKNWKFRTVHVKNPAGSITIELVKALSDAMNEDEPVKIMVDGEEDLAALPAIALAPVSSVVIYGLPDEGAIMVTITTQTKSQICDLLERMECGRD